MSDLINRQDVLDTIKMLRDRNISAYEYDKWIYGIKSVEPKWIPCSERLPKLNSGVLVTDEGDVLTGYINSLNEWMDFHGNRLKGVIAWMPLPEAYKPQENEDKE